MKKENLIIGYLGRFDQEDDQIYFVDEFAKLAQVYALLIFDGSDNSLIKIQILENLDPLTKRRLEESYDSAKTSTTLIEETGKIPMLF